jgi:hypothetical protein
LQFDAWHAPEPYQSGDEEAYFTAPPPPPERDIPARSQPNLPAPWQVQISASTGKPCPQSTWMCPVKEPEREHANTGEKPKNKVLAPTQAPEARSPARVQRGGGKQKGFGDLAGNSGGFSVSSFATNQMLKMGFVVGKVCVWICVLRGGWEGHGSWRVSVRIRQQTSAYVSIRQHTPAYEEAVRTSGGGRI